MQIGEARERFLVQPQLFRFPLKRYCQFAFRPLKISEGFSHGTAQFRQLLRAEEDKRQEQNEDRFRPSEWTHCRISSQTKLARSDFFDFGYGLFFQCSLEVSDAQANALGYLRNLLASEQQNGDPDDHQQLRHSNRSHFNTSL